MPHSYVWHDSFICVTCLNHTYAMAHSYVRHDSFICVTWLIHMRDMPHSYKWHDSFICVTCLNHTCAMPYSYMSRFIHVFMPNSFGNDLFALCGRGPPFLETQFPRNQTWHFRLFWKPDMPNFPQTEHGNWATKKKHEPSLWVVVPAHAQCDVLLFESRPAYAGVMSRIWKGYVSNMKESYHTYERVMSHMHESRDT